MRVTIARYARRIGLPGFALTAPLTIAGMQIAAGVVGLAALLGVERQRLLATLREWLIGWGPWLTVAVLSGLFMGHVDHALAKHWIYLPIWWLAALPLTREERLRLLVIAIGVNAVLGLYGILQHIYSIDPESVFKLAFVRPPDRPWWEAPRAQGLFAHALTFGGQSAMLFGAGAVLALRREPSGRRRLVRLLLIGVAVGIWLSLARSVWLASAVAAGFAALTMRPRLVVPVIVAIGLTALVLGSLHRETGWRATSLWTGDAPNQRVGIWRDSMALIEDHPWLGVGYGDYRTEIVPYRGEAHVFHHPHSMPLLIWAETGVAGLLAWLWLWYDLGRRWWRKRSEGPLIHAAGAAALAFMLVGLFECNFIDSEPGFLFGFLVAVLYTPAEEQSACEA